jgi:solute carrier family 25 (mitochondrial aspartate/glutamate transporter), member 12/13
MATVAETVKESLLGTSQPAELSASSRTTFLKHARRDEDTGELYMGEEEFVNAIAPPDQDYVSLMSPIAQLNTNCSLPVAQNQA